MRKKTKEGLEIIVLLGLGSLAVVLPLSVVGGEATPREERAVQGERTYQVYCASCHGATGRGDGPMADALKVHPVDLTGILRGNGGAFPEERVAAAIDGRQTIHGHGSGSMPVWGLSFQVSGLDSDQELEVREKIRDLVAYIETIQEK